MGEHLYLDLIIPIFIWDIIMIIFYFILIIIVGKNYSNQFLPSQLKLELVISSFLHQISMIPLFTKDNSKFEILCYIQVFLSMLSGLTALSFGLVIPTLLYQMLKKGEIIEQQRLKYHTIISLVIWGGLGIVSFLLMWFSKPRFEDDTICWYTETIIDFIQPGLVYFLCLLILISYFYLRKRIKEYILQSNENSFESNYDTILKKFLLFLIPCLLLNVIGIFHNFSSDDTFQKVLLFIEDIVEILFYPFIAAGYCLNYDNWITIKSKLCCQKYLKYSNKEMLNQRKTEGISMLEE